MLLHSDGVVWHNMTQLPGNATPSDISSQIELIYVLVETQQRVDECVLFPQDATEDELHEMWIRAKQDSYVHPHDAR